MKKAIWMISLLFLTACSREVSIEPEEINPDIDVCVVCNMSITEKNYATEMIMKDGEIYKFDDIGCMMEYMHKHGEEKESIAAKYVRDVNSGKWIKLEDAYYAYHKEFWTPMAYGVVSFAKKEDAEKFVAE
ncbi:copper chaperone NosL [Anoxybacillus vitaminiphilus]|uniref:Copper chaperone NosL n=1 Tax=Paranoxybacillus vitaminiphilus TaxID=581036 RepID=A0A327YB95_9BACL|nr:nitrous oxide reductase accessory protein NosL [Anoxybacillus vitaminiphilus]RAK18398.1 copper chaperone NosL [Anoxybacillus vitaminiphilus]